MIFPQVCLILHATALVTSRVHYNITVKDIQLEDPDSQKNASVIESKDELLIGDTALVLDHIDIDIGEFEDLKRRIRFLEATMLRHGQRRVVEEKEVRPCVHTLTLALVLTLSYTCYCRCRRQTLCFMR